MGKVIIGTFLFIAGLFISFTGVGIFIGFPMFAAGMYLAITGFGSLGFGAARLGFKAVNSIASDQTPTTFGGQRNAVGTDMAKWRVLAEVDQAIASAASVARAHSPLAEQLLAQKYMLVQDKQYLNALVEKSMSEASVLSERKTQQAQRYKIGNTSYRITEAGTYLVLGGKHVGKVFDSAGEMARYLGVPESDVQQRV